MYSMILMTALATAPETPSFHGRFARCGVRVSCYGCWASCYGCRGCWSSCYGCYGGVIVSSCHGCWSSCHGCFGAGTCYGCYGVLPVYGTPAYSGLPPVVVPPSTPTPAPPGEKAPTPKMTSTPNAAHLVIDIPAEAKLFVDDQPIEAGSGLRRFHTPSLEPGQKYFYILRAEVVRDGEKFEEVKRVIVEANQTIRLGFDVLTAKLQTKSTIASNR